MWRPLMKGLAKTHLVVAPDLRGFGDSTKAESGYDKKTMAQDVHALAKSLGIQKTAVAGHDIGLMVAYAYAAQYPSEVDRLAPMDAFIPGVGDTTNLFLRRPRWATRGTSSLHNAKRVLRRQILSCQETGALYGKNDGLSVLTRPMVPHSMLVENPKSVAKRAA